MLLSPYIPYIGRLPPRVTGMTLRTGQGLHRSAYPLEPGRSSGRLAKLSEVAYRRKEVRIVPKGLSEKAEHLLRQVVILGGAYQREDVPWRVLVDSTAVGEDEYEAVAEELVEAGLAESVDSDYAGLRATLAGNERVRGLGK